MTSDSKNVYEQRFWDPQSTQVGHFLYSFYRLFLFKYSKLPSFYIAIIIYNLVINLFASLENVLKFKAIYIFK